jgi:hypothetical protein
VVDVARHDALGLERALDDERRLEERPGLDARRGRGRRGFVSRIGLGPVIEERELEPALAREDDPEVELRIEPGILGYIRPALARLVLAPPGEILRLGAPVAAIEREDGRDRAVEHGPLDAPSSVGAPRGELHALRPAEHELDRSDLVDGGDRIIPAVEIV